MSTRLVRYGSLSRLASGPAEEEATPTEEERTPIAAALGPRGEVGANRAIYGLYARGNVGGEGSDRLVWHDDDDVQWREAGIPRPRAIRRPWYDRVCG